MPLHKLHLKTESKTASSTWSEQFISFIDHKPGEREAVKIGVILCLPQGQAQKEKEEHLSFIHCVPYIRRLEWGKSEALHWALGLYEEILGSETGSWP